MRDSSFLPELISPASGLADFHTHWQAVHTLFRVLSPCRNDLDVQQQLMLHTELPRQLFSCVAVALQHLATTGVPVSPEEPALVAVAHLSGMAELLFQSFWKIGCCPQLATVIRQSGEHSSAAVTVKLSA
jgi:hypothetical protein